MDEEIFEKWEKAGCFAIKENWPEDSENRSMKRMKEIVERYLYTVWLGLITNSHFWSSRDQSKT